MRDGGGKGAVPVSPAGEKAGSGDRLGHAVAMGDGNHRRALRRNDETVLHLSFRLAPLREARAVDGGEAHLRAFAGNPEIIGCAQRQLHRAFERCRIAGRNVDEHMPAFRNRPTRGQNVAGGKTAQILEDDDIGATAGGDEAEIGTAEPLRGIERCGAQRPFGLQAITDEAAHHIVKPTAS